MAYNNFIRLPTDSTGKKIRTRSFTEGEDELHDSVTRLSDDSDNIVNPATEETLQSILAAQGGSVYEYIQSAEDVVYKYYGYASSTGWKIKRKTLATGVWEMAYDDGDYATAWADRENKNYSYV